MNITLQQLQFFRAVARNLSFSNAAKELYTSQPYVSNQIRKLEDHFGIPLFLRRHPKIALTETGAALYGQVDKIFDDIDKLEALAKQFQGLHRGTLHIAATASAGNHVMPEMVARFREEHPDIVVSARIGNTDDVLEWLDLEDIDIGISPREPAASNLRSDFLYREELVVIFPASMELPDPISAEQFANQPKVVREGGSLTRSIMYELLGDLPAGREFVAQFSGTTAVNEAVASGLGVSLVPEGSAEVWVKAGTVRKSRVEGADLHHDFYLFYSERYLTPAARAFIDHVHQDT